MLNRIFNLLTVLMLLLTGVAIIVMVMIGLNPYTPLNPFPPEPLPTLMPTPTRGAPPTPRPTDTPNLTPSPTLPPTWTPTPSPTPTEATPTPSPTETPTPRPQATWTPTPITPTPTKTPTPTPTPVPFNYVLNYAVPYYGCNWTGVADEVGRHLKGYPIRITGGGLNEVVYSGSAPVNGESGWEYAFSTTELIRSIGEFRVQLYDKADPKRPLSYPVILNFPGNDCTRALAFVAFTKLP